MIRAPAGIRALFASVAMILLAAAVFLAARGFMFRAWGQVVENVVLAVVLAWCFRCWVAPGRRGAVRNVIEWGQLVVAGGLLAGVAWARRRRFRS